MDAKRIISMIKEAKKRTPATIFVSGELDQVSFEGLNFVGGKDFGVINGDFEEIMPILERNAKKIRKYQVDVKARNSALPLSDLTKFNARIEPGAIIRDMVKIGDGAVIMMGAVINIGSEIGAGTMIDMNVVVGGRAIIGNNCHIGAGTVVAGVVEPPSEMPVIIEDNVLTGANSVILEGVRVGKGSVVAAGAVVTKDVPSGVVVAGVPAQIVKKVDEKTLLKTALVPELRILNIAVK
ncbi:MAG: 2,3,4,5-tetrahydropyridine-2,6-dicarboxylate N-acetyltransferase [Candidatus Riflebacteria bacterium]|nr:2,3,4,5-tetrahydropyridine-2,6-dicarboxylate N-acetyltransferase [Candidatus Riflebacteria bacterium]